MKPEIATPTESSTSCPASMCLGNIRKNASFTVDELMAAAGLVSGDKSQFVMPRVYHKDWDRLNCKSDNLEWIDERDPNYIGYMDSWKTK